MFNQKQIATHSLMRLRLKWMDVLQTWVAIWVVQFSAMEQDKRNCGLQPFFASSSLVLANVDQSLQFEVSDQRPLCLGTQTPRAYGSAGHGLYVIAVNRITGGSYHRFYTKSSNSFSCKYYRCNQR